MRRRQREVFSQESGRGRGPVPIGEVVSKLLSRGGYAQGQQALELRRAWHDVAGCQFSHRTRVGSLRRGVLEIFVANSSLLQELTFKKHQFLRQLLERVPDKTLTDIRFRIGRIESNQEP
jgi:hypothetical protein